jgi:hypothetical protein
MQNKMSEAYTGNLLDRREERALPRQFQPRKMLVVVDDVVNDAEVNMVSTVTGEVLIRLPGSECVVWQKRGIRNLGDPISSSEHRGKVGQRYEGDLMGDRESDYFIVLRDGRTDHMGKGVAKRCSSQRKQESDA